VLTPLREKQLPGSNSSRCVNNNDAATFAPIALSSNLESLDEATAAAQLSGDDLLAVAQSDVRRRGTDSRVQLLRFGLVEGRNTRLNEHCALRGNRLDYLEAQSLASSSRENDS
jgi:hypothetical protein